MQPTSTRQTEKTKNRKKKAAQKYFEMFPRPRMTHRRGNLYLWIYGDSCILLEVRIMKVQKNGVHHQIDGYWKSNAFGVGKNWESNPPKTAPSNKTARQNRHQQCNGRGKFILVLCSKFWHGKALPWALSVSGTSIDSYPVSY